MREPQSGAVGVVDPAVAGPGESHRPFLRADVPAVQRAVGMMGGDPIAVFAEVRHRKDIFRQGRCEVRSLGRECR